MKKKLGLALSGGGSKGLLQVGALQFFEENRIKFKTLSGTSAGSIVSGLYSCGKKPIEILEFFETTKMFSTTHLAFNSKGFVNTPTLRAEFENAIGNPNIEDLENSLQIVATNLLDGSTKIFDRGNMIDAILASSAFPGVFTPMEIDGIIYSDGGMVNNFPIDLIHDKVDVSVGINLATFVNVKENELNNMFDILSRSYDIIRDSHFDEMNSIADINFTPTSGLNLDTFDTDPEKLNEIFEIGYDYTQKYFAENPGKLSLLKNV
ncbi:MAG: patatin-like phospholipase family protein [Flavobacteriales bacterium]|nr:patatin-like phospholipase family protein [Flavobacteriales bacterium]